MPKKKRITLQDIADACGVSRNTVSQALRDTQLVSKQTRELVQAKAQELGYVRDPQLTRIMTQLSERRKNKDVVREEVAYLECIRPSMKGPKGKIKEPTHHDFFEGARQFMESQGYRLNCYFYKDDKRTISQLDRIFESRGIRGVIVSPLYRDLDTIKLNWGRLAGVALGRQLRKPMLNRVDINYANHGRTCYQELKKLGCKRIGLIMPSIYDGILQHVNRSTYLGQSSLDEVSPPIPVLDTNYPVYHHLDTAEATEWIETHSVDGVMTLEEDAIITREAIEHINRKIQLAIVRIHHSETEAGMLPDARAVGEAAAQQLLSDLTFGRYGTPENPKLVQIAGKWVDRRD